MKETMINHTGARPASNVNAEVRAASRAVERLRTLRQSLIDYLGLAAVLALLVIFFSLVTDHFFSLTTFRTIANQTPDLVIVAVGMTFVLIVAGIDLSVGSVLALAGAVLGVCLVDYNTGLPLAVLACLATGLLCGATNSFFIVRFRLPSFIVTLGMLEIARGAAYIVTDSQTKYVGTSIEQIAEASFLGLSVPFLTAVFVVLVGQFVLTRTVFGRYCIATGTNEEAVRLSGVNTRSIRFAVFALCSLLAALAAIFHSARLASADPNAGIGFELQAIAATVIGGTSLMGGRGSIISSFFGVLIIAVLGAGLAQVGAQEPTKRLVTGCVIVLAVLLDYYRRRSATVA